MPSHTNVVSSNNPSCLNLKDDTVSGSFLKGLAILAHYEFLNNTQFKCQAVFVQPW